MSNSTLSFTFAEATILYRPKDTAGTHSDAHSGRERLPVGNIRSWGLWKNSSRFGVLILGQGAATYTCYLLGPSRESREF
jgi:hypothetical protein